MYHNNINSIINLKFLQQHVKPVSWNEFVKLFLSKGEVQELTIYPRSNRVKILLYDDAVVNNKVVSMLDIFSLRKVNLS